MTKFARKYCPIGTYAPIDQTFSQYKSKALSPWLYDCPSQILRNSVANWYQTYWKFIRGECGKPRTKRKDNGGSVHLTRELFRFVRCDDGNLRLFIGSKRNNIGYLSIKKHRKFALPNSLYIKKRHGKYWVSFCYEEASKPDSPTKKETLKHLRDSSLPYLEKHTIGIDRGVTIPIQAGDESFDFSRGQKKNKSKHEKTIKRLQRRLSKKQKKSVRYKRIKHRINTRHEKIGNIRKDFCHKTSRRIVDNKNTKIIILEVLKTKNLTEKPAPKPDGKGGWEKNKASAKAGLNKAILDKGWHQFEVFVSYKAERAGKVVFKVSAHYTSQACVACDHTHPNNRKSQSEFVCERCGHSDNADRNAAYNIKKQAIKLITHSGTELSKRGVLTPSSDKGRGAEGKPKAANAPFALGCETPKKKRKPAVATAG